jgi:hypothetical protein
LGKAKDIRVLPISATDANRLVKAIHYSGKVVNNSQIHLGVFLDGKCGGALQFGPPLDKRKLIGLVRGTKWNEFIELNRLAFADWLPRNSESRAIGYAMRFLKKNYPWLKWVVSFADGTQCGDGTIYRASGFVLTGIKKNTEIWEAPRGSETINSITHRKANNVSPTGASSMKRFKEAGWFPKKGFMLRYLYFLDPAARSFLTVPEIPFSEIGHRDAGMYKGRKVERAGSIGSDVPDDQSGKGGASPTPALQSRRS